MSRFIGRFRVLGMLHFIDRRGLNWRNGTQGFWNGGGFAFGGAVLSLWLGLGCGKQLVVHAWWQVPQLRNGLGYDGLKVRVNGLLLAAFPNAGTGLRIVRLHFPKRFSKCGGRNFQKKTHNEQETDSFCDQTVPKIHDVPAPTFDFLLYLSSSAVTAVEEHSGSFRTVFVRVFEF